MKVFHGLDSVTPALTASSLTIGNFDGMHRGHQRIVAQTIRLAADAGAPAVALTFEPHPLDIVAPERAPSRLTVLSEKLDQLAAAGIDVTVVARADRALLALTPEQFAGRIVERLHPTYIVEGASFGFGRGRSGTTETLRKLGPGHGFEVFVVDPVQVHLDSDTVVDISSSLIRRLLTDGQVHRAAECLGRPYALAGEVVTGARRGVRLGFPTANIDVGGQLVPADGVYAGTARLAVDSPAGAGQWPAAVSIGSTPTFQESGEQIQRRVEAHLLDADPDTDLYGQEIRLDFGVRLRGQERFESPDGLQAQIARDVEAVRRYTRGESSRLEP
ncbi:MAG TPA: bifunctional riboflavin kinase/FAD synthetase [Phycisphaerae bacterium]|nr:bifunctional riboflavin kinase/FAD synthetase [Phycisphaerae bacterium]